MNAGFFQKELYRQIEIRTVNPHKNIGISFQDGSFEVFTDSEESRQGFDDLPDPHDRKLLHIVELFVPGTRGGTHLRPENSGKPGLRISFQKLTNKPGPESIS